MKPAAQGGPATAGPAPGRLRFRLPKWAATLKLVVRESFDAFVRNAQFDTAAMLAYYGFLSVIPLLLLMLVGSSRFVLAFGGAREGVLAAAEDLLPGLGGPMLRELETLSRQGIWSLLSLVLLLWSVTPLAAGLRAAFARVFSPDRPLSFLKSKLRDLAGALTLVGLFAIIVMGKIVYAMLSDRFQVRFSVSTDVMNIAFTFAFALGGLCFFYAMFVPVRLRFVEILAGALVALALLWVLRPAFSAFLRYNPNYGFAFGSLKAVFLMFTWVYFSFSIILYGAEIMAGARRRDVVLLRGFLAGTSGPDHGAPVLIHKFLRTYPDGGEVFAEGAEGHEMFFIRAGAVDLVRGGQTLSRMEAGRYFGEMAMLIDARRSAGAVAAPGTELIAISRDNFDTILRENPQIAQAILREMAVRLRHTDERWHAAAAGASNSGGGAEDVRG